MMHHFIKLQEFVFIYAIIKETICIDYCKIESCKGDHTMCKYPNDTVACTGDGVKAGLTEELRKAILDRHNVHRQSVALGKQPPQPHAANMMKLFWHDEAEKIAQRWANQCVFSHDSCRNLENAMVGQNIATQSLDLNSPDVNGAILKMVDMWYGEIKDFNKEHVTDYKFDESTAHYTQMVWAETTAIGCGFIQLPAQPHYRMSNLVCNYVPSGNYLNHRVYKKGKACGECPEETKCSKSYPGLCTSDKNDFGGVPKDAGDPDDAAGGIAISSKPSMFVLLCVFGSYNVLAE